MPNELKPCPFCGGMPFVAPPMSAYENWWAVGCPKCRIAQTRNAYTTLSKAIEAWNRRAGDAD